MREYMSTAEVAEYLRLKERKVYELAAAGRIPCARVTGKWLFPRRLIDAWVLAEIDCASPGIAAPPPVVAGSADPLLEWALRESGCDLALLAGGSGDGLARLADGRVLAAGLHIIDPADGSYNVSALERARAPADVVLIEWARRAQGLIVPPGNPRGVSGLGDAVAMGLRLARRQEGAGAQTLLLHLLAKEGVAPGRAAFADPPARSESDLAGQVADGVADAGIGIEAAARRLRLGFICLHVERFDLAVRRRDYFEPPFQALLAFARTDAFRKRADELGGYDVANLGRVAWNG